MAIDRYDWHYESAEKAYCERNGINGELTDEQRDEICLYAADHIGMFLQWIITNGFEGEESDPEGCELVRRGEINGTRYLMDCCDGKLWDVDLSEEIRPFVAEYYEESEKYFDDYSEAVGHKVYEKLSGSNEFEILKPLIDKAYEEFKNNKR